MDSIKSIIKPWVPPAILQMLRSLLHKEIYWKGSYPTWGTAAALSSGYDANVILEKVLDATLKIKRGEFAFERDSILFQKIQYSWPVTAALMLAAAKNSGELHVLDFGGALGSSYFQNRPFLLGLKKVSWSVVEQSNFVHAGERYIQNDIIKFFNTIKDCLKVNKPNVILLSSVAQYLPHVDDLICEINKIDASILIFDRTPFALDEREKICIQIVPEQIYRVSYPMRILSLRNLLSSLTNWKLTEEFLCPEGMRHIFFGPSMEFLGLIFERADDR